ncbi:ankyrin [Aspergillus sclerotioniger CBS 115572]|uniref:Ankyrin n=1 Tax=Aspergillus sclerotioniger CBS 115572 TaxID=1450535 RepID=A0A317X8N4_9EURO|nr:ankyrin [Aspergillus sclerotioniger CBS 115572]PWY94645.1 ankyrin [Aspergillus sclerotioniger CBS 115572]
MEPPIPSKPLFRGHTAAIGDWPLELCLHMEECLGVSVKQFVLLRSDMSFYRLLQVEAILSEDRALVGFPLEIYRCRYIGGRASRCLFEPCTSEAAPRLMRDGNCKGLQHLLDNGMDPCVYSTSEIPLLALAVAHMQLECVRLLLHYQANPNQTGYWRDARPLDYVLPHCLSDSYPTQSTIIEVLIEAGGTFTFANVIDTICVDNRLDLLHQAVCNGTKIRDLSFAYGATALHRAALNVRGGPEIIDYILEQAPELLNARNTAGHTALQYALWNPNRIVAMHLLRYPIDLYALDVTKESALTTAIGYNRMDIVDAIMGRKDLDMLQLHRDIPFHQTPLGRAITTRNEELLDFLLSYPRMHVPKSARDLALDQTRATFKLHECWIPMIERLPVD